MRCFQVNENFIKLELKLIGQIFYEKLSYKNIILLEDDVCVGTQVWLWKADLSATAYQNLFVNLRIIVNSFCLLSCNFCIISATHWNFFTKIWEMCCYGIVHTCLRQEFQMKQRLTCQTGCLIWENQYEFNIIISRKNEWD